MPVRVFQGHEIDGIADVEREANAWLNAQPPGTKVTHLDTAFCGAPNNGGLIFTVTIYYVTDDPQQPK